MAQDWASDVKRYHPEADDDVIAGIVRYCGIALQKRDSSLVSFGDAVETGRVRENFLRKKLGLTHSDEELDSAIAAVGQKMQGDNFKNRVTVYYLLTDRFGMHHLFRKGGGGASAAAAAASAAGVAGVATGKPDLATPPPADSAAPLMAGGAAAAGLGAAGLGAGHGAEETAALGGAAARPVADTVAAERLTTHVSPHEDAAIVEDEREGGLGWLWWLIGLALLGLLLWWLFFRQPATDTTATSDTAAVATATAPDGTTATATATAAPAADAAAGGLAAAPAEGTVAIPDGAGVTVEARDGKPVAKVYFASGKTDVVPDFGATASAMKDYLASRAGSSLAVSGYNDPTGNAAANAELSKNRAQAVKAALVAAGVPESAIELVKPDAATDATTNKAAARRVEVVVR